MKILTSFLSSWSGHVGHSTLVLDLAVGEILGNFFGLLELFCKRAIGDLAVRQIGHCLPRSWEGDFHLLKRREEQNYTLRGDWTRDREGLRSGGRGI